MKRKTRKDECGCVGDGGEIEDERERMNVDVSEMAVKQKTTDIG